MRTFLPLTLGVLAFLSLTVGAQAQQKTWCIGASEAEEVPPTGSSAVANAVFTLDLATNELSWVVTHSGLTGSFNACHLHGPAAIGQNAGVQLNLGTGSPVVGSAFLTATQKQMLNMGQMYLNLHTSGFPSGEVRGQVDDVCVENICVSLANSFDPAGARLEIPGDFMAMNNAITFTGTGVPPGQFGMLIVGAGTSIVNPPGSQGNLCLAGAPIGRFATQIKLSDGAGVLGPFTPDIANLPNPPGGAIFAGDTWGFQIWFRDVGGFSNFSDAASVTFL